MQQDNNNNNIGTDEQYGRLHSVSMRFIANHLSVSYTNCLHTLLAAVGEYSWLVSAIQLNLQKKLSGFNLKQSETTVQQPWSRTSISLHLKQSDPSCEILQYI
jgi:hypothetical protein